MVGVSLTAAMDQPDILSLTGRIVDESFDRNFTRNCTLCLLLLSHLLAYAVYDEEKRKFTVSHSVYLESELENAQYLAAIQSIISKDDLLHLPFQSVVIGIGSKASVLVPTTYYHNPAAGLFLSLQAQLIPDEAIRSDSISFLNAVLEYAIYEPLREYLENTFSNSVLYNANTSLLLGLERERPDRGKAVYVFIQRHLFNIVVFEDGQLRFFNSYQFQSTEDFLYFILLVFDELSLDRETTPVVLLGEIVKESAIFNTVQGYLGNLQFGRRPRGFRYNRAIRELPGQFFYNLFALQLCAL